LTIAQARAYLHMRNGEFRKLVRSGEIPSVRHCRATLVHAQDLDAWMRRQQSGANVIATALKLA
jgi:excisionase family DNA binding protein